MNKPVTVFVDSGKAVARLSGPLVLGDTYAVAFSGLSTEEAASAPEMIVLGPKPREIAARSGEDGVLAMTTKPCVEAFGPLPPPPLPRPKQFPHPPPLANPPVHWRGGPHGSTRMHFYVVAGGQTLAQGDLVLLWAPFEFDEAGEPIQLKGDQGPQGERGPQGEQGLRGLSGFLAQDDCVFFDVDLDTTSETYGHLFVYSEDEHALNHGGDETKPHWAIRPVEVEGVAEAHIFRVFYNPDSGDVQGFVDLGSIRGPQGPQGPAGTDGAKGDPLTWADLTDEQKASLKGEKGDPLTWADLTDEQKASLKGAKGDPGEDGMSEEEIVALVNDTMGEADDAPVAGSQNWVTSGGLWSVEQAIIARIASVAESLGIRINQIDAKASSAYHFKGSVATADLLPMSGNETGDVWNVTETGVNYSWTGTSWDALGSIIDLSVYRTAEDQDAIDDAQDTAIAAKYTKPTNGIPASDLAPGVIPTVPSASDADPLMDGAASPGVSADFSRADHTHPTSRNILRVSTSSSGVTLAPETAVYRAPIAADGTFPTLDAAGIQTGAQYYRFGLELAVPSPIPAALSAPSTWQWIPGKSLPDPSTLRPPTTLHLNCRMDCSSASRPIVAACDWVDGPVDVEYLESTSGQYIDTGVPNGEPFTVFLDFSIDASAVTNDSLFGSFASSSRRMIYVTALTNGKKRLQLSHGGSGNTFSVGDLVAGTRHTVRVHQAGSFEYQVDGGAVGTRNFGADLAAQSGVTLWLFNRSGTSFPCNMRLYSAQIRDANDVLVRDYQPVRVGTTGELYDSVNKAFATRVGTFVVGPDKNA